LDDALLGQSSVDHLKQIWNDHVRGKVLCGAAGGIYPKDQGALFVEEERVIA